MHLIDWASIASVALGLTIGSFLGYWLSLRRMRSSPAFRARMQGARRHGEWHAALTALGAFFALALVEDVASALQRDKPGFALVKYLFAAAIGITYYAALRHAPVGAASLDAPLA